MPTTVTKVIDPDSGAGYDYDSLFDWEAAQQGDLTGVRDEIAVAKCRSTSGTADTTAVTINGWTTDGTRYIKVWCDPAESYRHAGVWNDSGSRFIFGSGIGIRNYQTGTILDGLQLSSNPVGVVASGNHIIQCDGSSTISNCILKGHGHASYTQTALRLQSSCYVFNTIIYNITALSGNIGISSAYTSSVYSSTIIGGNYGLSRSSNYLYAKNVYCGGSLSGDFATHAFLVLTTCGSSDTTGSVGLQSIAYTTDNFLSVTPGNANYLKLAATGALTGSGTDTSGESAPLNFTTDIAGTTRSDWDIGAFEYVAGEDPITVSFTDSLASWDDTPGGMLAHDGTLIDDWSNLADVLLVALTGGKGAEYTNIIIGLNQHGNQGPSIGGM